MRQPGISFCLRTHLEFATVKSGFQGLYLQTLTLKKYRSLRQPPEKTALIDNFRKTLPMTTLAQTYEVLVVDDSPVYRELLQRMLSGPEYSVSFACNGSEAVRLHHDNSPDIIITDWIMPDFSGLELCARVRADKSSPYTYIILMTSNTEKSGVVKGLEAGADDYLVKPFDSSEMLARIGVGRRIIDL